MANPNPQHNPTDGLGTAAKIALSGTGITQVAGNVYKVSLNVSGSPNPATVAVTSTVEDVNGNTFTSGNSNSVKLKSYNDPSITETVVSGYSAKVASVSGSTVTALHAGQAIIEAQFPTFDNTEGTDTNTGDPKDMIYAQLIVTVGA